MKTRLSFVVLSSLALVLMTSSAGARPLATAVTTAFTYQGRLTDGGPAADGAYDFTFRLFDDASAGSPVGSLLTKDDVAVSGGLFTVQLDFGDVFNGTALWLEIAVRPGASIGAYTTLSPRQALTATPFAIYASKAPWSGLTGVPAGFVDGVDNGSSYQNLVVVAKSGGDFTTITDALNSITTASSVNRYLIYVAPGIYTEQVTMKQFVDIQGSGELNTKITHGGSASANTGTLIGVYLAEVRFLTVENTGGSVYAIAVYNNNAGPRLTHITASASGATSASGVHNYLSSPILTDVTASGSGTTESMGIWNESFSQPTMKDVVVTASGGTNAYGIFNDGSWSTITDSTVGASGGTGNYGIYNSASSGSYTVEIQNSHITGNTNSIFNNSHFTVEVGASQLKGGAASAGGGSLICAGIYDENYAYSATTCP